MFLQGILDLVSVTLCLCLESAFAVSPFLVGIGAISGNVVSVVVSFTLFVLPF